jgi:hypothetical protein
MSSAVTPARRLWIAGFVAGIAGAVLSSMGASASDGFPSFVPNVASLLLACGVFLIICLGLRRRIETHADLQEPARLPHSIKHA